VQAGNKSTQRERLVGGMTQVAAGEGYRAATIARVIAAAQVSRPTFYEYFSDRDDCFLAALNDAHELLLADVAQGMHDAPRAQALSAAINAIIAFAVSRPQPAQLLMNEALAGGPRILTARDQGLGEIASVIEQAQQQLPPGLLHPDIPPRVLLGTLYRLLARKLRAGEHHLSGVLDDVLEWIKSYERPAGEHRWRALEPLQTPAPWTILPETLLREPAALGRGRQNRSERAENERQRILFAAATVAERKGYAATTIADIAARAGVDRRAFNALFAGKEDAFTAVISLGFQRTIAVTAGAFFTGAEWPERIWQAGRAFTGFMQGSPALAHVGFVEPYAVGIEAAELMENSVAAFKIFLLEGLRHHREAVSAATALGLDAIATSIFETCYQLTREQRSGQMSSMLPHVTFLCLAPIIGAAQANEFIDQRLKIDSPGRQS
jgi:AcrR family transcriptional regulator